MNESLSRDRSTWLLAALLALVTLAVYSSALTNGFVEFDDPAYITSNPHVLTGLTSANIRWAFTSFDEANWHPITWISHMIDVQFFGVRAAGHHAVSAIIHAINAAFLFLILFWGTNHRWRSLTVAALFALHPMNVETVAWAAERKSLLCMFFSLATVALYSRYASAPQWKRYLLVVVAFALALMSKPMAVTVPVLLLLFDYWPLNRIDQESKGILALIREKLPLFAMSLASGIITIIAQRRGHSVTDLIRVPFSERLANAAVATVTYVRRAFWPDDLSYFYPHPGSTLSRAAIFAAIILLIGISALVYRFRERRYLVVGWMMFLIALLPVIGILQVGMQAMADRYAYLPTIGLFIGVVWGIADLRARSNVSEIAVATVATVALGLLGGCTIITEHYWHDSLTLFIRAHNVAPRPSVYIETNLAAALLDQNRPNDALQHFRIAASVAPQDFIPHYNIAFLLETQGDHDGALSELHQALACETSIPGRTRALNLLASIYLKRNERQQAIDVYRQLLQMYPNSATVKAHIRELQN